ncbi:MAG TPA: hypothetical protein VLQ52_06030 [Coriobacteriia bacterium]|nr:hypothetical protein [Coriobacteriia bacterium]
MGHIDGKQTDGHRESAEDIVETYDRDGAAIRYRRDDFDEIYATVDTAEMRRLVSLGWLILDQRINREPGKSAPWIDTALRRFAGRVLPAQDDPEFRPPSDRTTYVLGHLKAGVKGTRVS